MSVLNNLLATGAAFGAAKLVFQDGIGSGLFGFESHGFLDASRERAPRPSPGQPPGGGTCSAGEPLLWQRP